ncbi:hypothetical protein ACQWE9_24905, partial [Salmonella enterica subsp. enterica serovar Infantis]
GGLRRGGMGLMCTWQGVGVSCVGGVIMWGFGGRGLVYGLWGIFIFFNIILFFFNSYFFVCFPFLGVF